MVAYVREIRNDIIQLLDLNPATLAAILQRGIELRVSIVVPIMLEGGPRG